MARPKKQEAPSSSTASTASAPSRLNAAADAFAKVEPKLAALPPEAIGPLDVDVSAAVTAVLAIAPKIRDFHAAIVEELPKHPVDHLDNLETYALAAWYAQIAHTYANASPDAAKSLLDEATKLREGLLIAAEALAHRGLLNADDIAKIRKGGGNADVANDLVALSSLFSKDWSKVSSKTAVERHEIDRAAELGPAVLVALTSRKQGGKQTDTADQRARAFTLLARAYDSCRRALSYLRWQEGDVDSIAPSLYKKRPGRKPGSKKEEGDEIQAGGAAAATEELGT
jgi:hypothetical protein